MDITAYIESGVLELYVMDALSPAEAGEVDAIAARHPSVAARIRALHQVFIRLAEAGAVEPRAGLRQETLDRVAQDRAPDVQPVNAPKGNPWLLATAAATIVVLGAALLYRTIAHRQTFNECREARTALEEQLQAQKANLDFLLRAGTQPIALKGTPLAPDAQVTVYWNPGTQTTRLAVSQLPPAPSGRQYQLWSLRNGQPKSAGLLSLEPAVDLQTMENVAEADMFAITEEPAGGVESPTLDRLVAAGNVASRSF
ncbi:MAG: anti-sigma factor [Saprospiraceae bacterium]|nr:anti-sigma factor [Saprospiraceae bacterium]